MAQTQLNIRVDGDDKRAFEDFCSQVGMNTTVAINMRSEERRVGKECRSRWSPYH